MIINKGFNLKSEFSSALASGVLCEKGNSIFSSINNVQIITHFQIMIEIIFLVSQTSYIFELQKYKCHCFCFILKKLLFTLDMSWPTIQGSTENL